MLHASMQHRKVLANDNPTLSDAYDHGSIPFLPEAHVLYGRSVRPTASSISQFVRHVFR